MKGPVILGRTVCSANFGVGFYLFVIRKYVMRQVLSVFLIVTERENALSVL